MGNEVYFILLFVVFVAAVNLYFVMKAVREKGDEEFNEWLKEHNRYNDNDYWRGI